MLNLAQLTHQHMNRISATLQSTAV